MSKVNEKDAAAATPETSKEEKTNLVVSLGSSSSHAQPEPAMPFMPGSVFHANPCDFLSIAGLLNVWLHDPSIKDIAKQIENDPSFNKMAEQFRQTFHGDGVRQFDIKRQYFFTMDQQVMQNPQLMTMAKSLGTFIMQDPSVSQMLESLSNPAKKEQLEVRMARIKENPSLKPILEEIESGGPTVMMRYWNDEDVLKKVGEAMGLAVTEDATASAGHRVADSRKLQELQQLDEDIKAMKANLMSLQKQHQLKEENVKAQKAKLTIIQEKKRQIDMEFEVSRAELMSVLEQYQHNEQSEALKARLMNLQEQQQERQQLINHDIFTLSQIIATAEQEVAADKQMIAPFMHMTAALVQRLAALEPRFAAKEQAIAMANDSTEPMRARVGVSVAVTIGVFSHVYR